MENSLNYADVNFSLEEVLDATGGKIVYSNNGNIKSYTFNGISTDSRIERPGSLFVAIKGEKFDGHNFIHQVFSSGCIGAIVSDIPTAFSSLLIKVDDTKKALGNLARFHRSRFSIPIVGVTGSYGKTTTKEIIAAGLKSVGPVLKTQGTFNNCIGLPLTLLGLKPFHKTAVLEVATGSPGDIESLTNICKPSMGVITNIGRAHIGAFGSVDRIRKEKFSLIEHLEPGSIAVLPFSDTELIRLAKLSGINFKTFGNSNLADFYPTDVRILACGACFKLNGIYDVQIRLSGMHNVLNVCAGFAACSYLGINKEGFASAVQDLQPLQMRLQLQKINDINIFMDCYNSNPDAVYVALDVFKVSECKGKKILVIGDMKELGDFSEDFHIEVGKRIALEEIDFLITVGEFAKIIAECARCSIGADRVFSVDDVNGAKKILLKIVDHNDCLLIKGSRAMQLERMLECFTTSMN
jgi:UDP-N-acetylmuramoyl-tripeptide--D-alanyl-D-alanine ligase